MRGRAILLAAGAGSRLRSAAPVKPLAEVAGRPLLLHSLHTLAEVGVAEAVVVTGHGADAVVSALASAPIPVEFRHNPDWASYPNGASLLAAADRVERPTLLMMADHLVSPVLIRRLFDEPVVSDALLLAVDRRLGHPWIDEADVTRVRTDGRAITGIGKGLLVHDCYDTGVFVITPAFIATLRSLHAPSLSEGVHAHGRGIAVDIGDAAWLDVDDPRALALARQQWARG